MGTSFDLEFGQLRATVHPARPYGEAIGGSSCRSHLHQEAPAWLTALYYTESLADGPLRPGATGAGYNRGLSFYLSYYHVITIVTKVFDVIS